MKEDTDKEFKAAIDECAAEVERMLKPRQPEPQAGPKGWRRYVVGILV